MKIKRAAAFLLAAAMVFSFVGCKNKGPKNANKTINYNLSSEPATLDPQIAVDTSSITVIQALFEGLARLDAQGKAQPGAAESWQANSDSTQFTFHLRSAKWSDKDFGNVTAADFVYAFRRALDPKTGSVTCAQMYCIKNAKQIHSGKLAVEQLGVTAKDNKTLVVNLEYSCPDFPILTAQAVYMPCNEKFFSGTSGRYGLEPKYLISNGPFSIDGPYGWDHGKTLRLARSAAYSGQNKVLPSGISFSIGTISNSIDALKDKTVDAAPIASSQTSAAKAFGCTLSSVQDTVWGLCFNTQSPVFKNEKIRTAFAQAFDRTAVLSHIPADSSAADSIMLPGTRLDGQLYRSVSGGPFYLKQSSTAAQTLAAGKGELSPGSLDSITVLCPNDNNSKMILNEMIAAWNKQFKSYFNMKPVSADSLQDSVRSGNYQVAIYPIKPAGDGPDAVLSLFVSGTAGNPAGLADPAYDTLVNSAQSKSGKEAASAYAAAEKYLNDKAIFYPLYYEKSYYALAKGITGIIFRPYAGGVDFLNAGKLE